MARGLSCEPLHADVVLRQAVEELLGEHDRVGGASPFGSRARTERFTKISCLRRARFLAGVLSAICGWQRTVESFGGGNALSGP